MSFYLILSDIGLLIDYIFNLISNFIMIMDIIIDLINYMVTDLNNDISIAPSYLDINILT